MARSGRAGKSSAPRTTNDGRPSATTSPTGLAVEANALADLKIGKAAVERERRTVEAEPRPVRYLATLIGATDQDALLASERNETASERSQRAQLEREPKSKLLSGILSITCSGLHKSVATTSCEAVTGFGS